MGCFGMIVDTFLVVHSDDRDFILIYHISRRAWKAQSVFSSKTLLNPWVHQKIKDHVTNQTWIAFPLWYSPPWVNKSMNYIKFLWAGQYTFFVTFINNPFFLFFHHCTAPPLLLLYKPMLCEHTKWNEMHAHIQAQFNNVP